MDNCGMRGWQPMNFQGLKDVTVVWEQMLSELMQWWRGGRTFLPFLFPVTCRSFFHVWGWLRLVEEVTCEDGMSSPSTSYFPADTFTNMQFAVITRKVSKVAHVHKGYVCTSMYVCVFFMRWNMFWVLIMHCQWTHVEADGFTAQVEPSHLRCCEVLSLPAQWDLPACRICLASSTDNERRNLG